MSWAVLSSLLTILIFPKFNFGWLAWIALVPLFYLLLVNTDRRQGLRQGFIFGLLFFAGHLYWLLTLRDFVGWWIVLGWLALTIFQALFLSLFIYTILHLRPSWRAIAIPFVWVGVEWLRAWGPFGVTGGDLGYSQVHFLALIQIASLTSVYGISFLVALVNSALAQLIVDRRQWRLAIVAVLLLGLTLSYGWQVLRQADKQITTKKIKLALIQANIPQKEKLNPAFVRPIFARHRDLTEQALAAQPDIVVWPETALFTYLLHDQPLLDQVQAMVRQAHCWFILGTPDFLGSKSYNTVIALAPTGQAVSSYYKQHLVPFGEYLPFRGILFPLLRGVGYYDSEFSGDQQPKPLLVDKMQLATAVCFESVFPGVIRERVTKDVAFILLLTNDAWFGNSAAAYFHLNTGILRAIENRKYFVQVGNTGFSALIDPYGRILKQSQLNRREALVVEIPLP